MCLWLINHQPGAIVHQPIVQLFGFDSFYQETILINGTHRWPIVQGLFKIYVELKPGDNSVHLSTSVSELTFTLIFCPESNAPMTVRLGSISPSDHSQIPLEHICKQFLFLTKLVRCTFDEILCKQLGSTRSLLFHIEKKFHHLTMSEHELAPDSTNQDIFKEIYGQISTTDLIEDPSVKLIVHSSIAPSNTFAYSQCSSFFSNFNKNVLAVFIRSDPAYKNVVVLNFPERFQHLPASFDEFYQILQTVKGESLFYLVGAYLHELGHLLGLDHGLGAEETIMSSSRGFIESGQDFFLASPRLCAIVLNGQCSCYRTPALSVSSSYSNGLLRKTCQYFQSSCRSDTHCQCAIRFKHQQSNQKPNECLCNGQFHFEIDHCRQLKDQFYLAIHDEKEAFVSSPSM